MVYEQDRGSDPAEGRIGMALSTKTKNTIRNIALAVFIGIVAYALFTGQLTLGGHGGNSDYDRQQGTDTPAIVDDGQGKDAQGTQGEDTRQPAGKDDRTGSVGAASATDGKVTVYEDQEYTTKAEVALYIHAFGHLPDNYVTKAEAEALGWTSEGGKEPYQWGKTIGGDYFGNYEGLLPKAKGRTWTECDVLVDGQKTRGAKRIVFSNDGLVYYCSDHYESFTQLY